MTDQVKHRRLRGIVVSEKMAQTVIVRVDRIATHPKYGKQYTVSRRFAAHDPAGAYHVGDQVWIEATRPLSATKRWRVISRI